MGLLRQAVKHKGKRKAETHAQSKPHDKSLYGIPMLQEISVYVLAHMLRVN